MIMIFITRKLSHKSGFQRGPEVSFKKFHIFTITVLNRFFVMPASRLHNNKVSKNAKKIFQE